MKLYAWYPKGHGSLSFFVMAENVSAAAEAVARHIAEDKLDRYCLDPWPGDVYILRIAEDGEVLINDNS